MRDPQLARLNFGILALHAVLMALFIVVPLSLRDAGLAVDHHWQVYLPVMLGSFALMLPAILIAERRGHVKTVFVGAIGVLLLGQLSMPWLLDSSGKIVAFLLIFFTAFNVLEAMLPSLTSKLAPPGAKGTAIGVYSSVQFLGTFLGAASGGFLYQHFGARGVFVFDAVLLAAWLVLAAGMQAPGPRPYAGLHHSGAGHAAHARRCLARLEAQPGVREVQLAAGERTAYLKVDAAGFDEQVVLRLRLIEGRHLNWRSIMASVNKVILVGNLGDPSPSRYLPDGGAVCNFSVATTDKWKDKSGEQQERTEWHRIATFSKLAEICGEYLKKGSQVYIEGGLQTRKWQDKEGQERYTTEIVADRMQMLGSRAGGRDHGAASRKRQRPERRGGGKPAAKKAAGARSTIWTTIFRSN